MSQHKAVWITGKGCVVLGRPRRRPPQPTQARDHEDAIVSVATMIEVNTAGRDDLQVLTEREIRARDARRRAGEPPYAVNVGAGSLRWPDLVVEVSGLRRAIEIEFAAKHRPRFRAIVSAYAFSDYQKAMFMVRSPSLARTLTHLIRKAQLGLLSGDRQVIFSVEPWHELPDALQAQINRAAGARA